MFNRDRKRVKKWFRTFSKKHPRKAFYLRTEEIKDEDSYNVFITAGVPRNQYLFQSMEGNTLHVKVMDHISRTYIEPATLHIDDISQSQVYGFHLYFGNVFKFNDLCEMESIAWKWRKFKIWRMRNLLGVRQKKYNKMKLCIDNRMSVLNAVMQLYMDDAKREPVDMLVIADHLLTKQWQHHPDSHRIWRELEMVLFSLCHREGSRQTGELQVTGRSFIPTTKAYATYNEYLLQEQRHRESSVVQKRMLWVTFFSATAAVASAVAALLQVK
ncbi:hypothetical protein P8H80_003225 [Escherichia coli]|nr:hypothetical protein [Escherichia coli]